MRGKPVTRRNLPQAPQPLPPGLRPFAWASSVGVHVVVALILIFGLEWLRFVDEMELVPDVEIVTEVPRTQVAQRPPEPPPPPPPPPPPKPPEPEPPKPEPPPPPPPKPPEPPPPPPPPEPPPKPPDPKPEPPEEKLEPAPPPPPRKPEPPRPPEPEKKVEPKKPDAQQEVADILKNLRPPPPRQAAPSTADKGPPLTQSEKDGVKAQIEKCWSFDPGTKWPETLVVKLIAKLDPTGVVVDLKPYEQQRIDRDPFYRAAFERARAALYCASPLKMPREKYGHWQETVLTFDPRNFLGF